MRAASQKIFHKIHTAYTGKLNKLYTLGLIFFYLIVLFDQKQREIYDKYGWEGIETAWQLGPHLDQSEKLTEELRKRSSAGFSELVQSKTSFTVAADFSEIVEDILDYDQLVYSDFLPKITSIGINESLETTFGADNSFSANFTTISQSGNVGAGNVNLNWRRPAPKLSGWMMENGLGFGSRKFLSSTLFGQLDKKTSASFQLVAGLKGGAIFPQFNSTFSRALNPSLIGNLQLIQPLGSAPGQLSLSFTTKTSPEVKYPFTLTLTLPTNTPFDDLLPSTLLEAKKTFPVDSKHEVRMKIGIQAVGGTFDLGIHRKWSEKTRASATLQLDQNVGASLRLGITHNSLHLILPLRFSQEFSPASIVLASLIPTVGDYISRNYIYPQLVKKRKEQYWAEYKQKRAAMMERKREEAELANELMKQNLEKKMSTKPSDLIILEAVYRSIVHPEANWPVSIPLQFLLNSEGKIRLDPAYRANILGFFDVAPSEAKETFIKYIFRDKIHEAIIPDTEELLLPQRSHLKDHQ